MVARTRDEQAAMDKYGITFDGENYNFGWRKFVSLSYAIKCADPNAYVPRIPDPQMSSFSLHKGLSPAKIIALVVVFFAAYSIYTPSMPPQPDTQTVSSSGSSSPTQNMSYILVEQDKIKSRLKDPDSAEFRNVFVSSKYAVCGEVNAKNSFGGYTGFVRFISGGDMQVVESDMAAGEMDKSWPQICMR